MDRSSKCLTIHWTAYTTGGAQSSDTSRLWLDATFFPNPSFLTRRPSPGLWQLISHLDMFCPSVAEKVVKFPSVSDVQQRLFKFPVVFFTLFQSKWMWEPCYLSCNSDTQFLWCVLHRLLNIVKTARSSLAGCSRKHTVTGRFLTLCVCEKKHL